MFKGKRILIKEAKNVVISDWNLRSKSLNEGFRMFFMYQSPLKRYFNRTRIPEYPAVEELPLPSNIEDLASSEKLKFSPQRSREINGSYIKFSILPITKRMETNPKIKEDERVQCYDCSGTINLSSAMEINVPFPFRSTGKPSHLNLLDAQWAQNEKYTSEDLNSLHHSNFKLSTAKGETGSFGFKNGARNSFLYFSALDLSTCDSLQQNFNAFNYQLRNFCSQKEKVENNGKHSDKKIEINNVSKLSRREKLKAAIRDYGSVLLVFHIGISLFSLGCCYCLVASGVNLDTIFKDWGVQEGATAAGTAAQFIVAYAIHKSIAPARIAVTLSVAPFIVKKLRKIGLLKPAQAKVE